METLFRAGVSNAVSATFLAMVVAGLSRPLARRPAILHGLWLLVLLKLVTPPLYELAIPWPVTSAKGELAEVTSLVALELTDQAGPEIETAGRDLVVESNSPIEIAEEVHAETGSPPSLTEWFTENWKWLLSSIWMGGTATIAVVSLGRIRRFQRLLRETRSASPNEQERVDTMAGRLGLRRSPALEWVQAKLSPMIWSLGWNSRLIIPRDLWKTLDEPQRSTLIVHELAHLRRGDHRVRYFELFVTALFWWHPLVWWVRQALRDAEEQCCDAWVVWAFPDAARCYAETLLETIDFLDKSKGPEPLFASGFGKVHHLRRRLTMILSESTPRRMGRCGMLGLFALSVMMLPVNASWAQKSGEPQSVDLVVRTGADLSASAADSTPVQEATSRIFLADAVTSLEGSPDGKVEVTIKSEDSPTVEVTGSLDEVIQRLKLMLQEVQHKSSAAGKKEALQEELSKAIEELVKVAPQIKGTVTLQRSGGDPEKRVLVVRSLAPHSPKKPLSPEENAEIEKLQAVARKLEGEVQTKQKALAEVHARLAKLQGVAPATVMTGDGPLKFDIPALHVTRTPEGKSVSRPVVVSRRSVAVKPVETTVRYVAVKPVHTTVVSKDVDKPVEKTRRKVVEVMTLDARAADQKPPKSAEVKTVDPTKDRLEITVKSAEGIVPGNGVFVHIEPNDKDKVTGSPDRQRIEALEKRLKALLDEVATIKKAQSKGSSGK
ncbi:MAG: M56 family metallopeptidase [Isosphaeraceae bacterium]